MDSLSYRIPPARGILAGLLLSGALGAGDPARARDPAAGPARPPARDTQAAARAQPNAGRPGPSPAAQNQNAQAPDQAQAKPPSREPSEAFRQSMRQTLEKRRQRRARRARGPALDDPRPVGAIVPWPLPPALIIRHTTAVHDEVDGFLNLLRR